MLTKSLSSLLIGSLLASVTVAAEAEVKIGYVDTQRVYREAPFSQKVQARIEAEFAKRDQDLKKMAKDIQTKQDYLDRNSATLSESDRRAREQELNNLNRDFQRRKREFSEDLNVRQNEEMAAILERAYKAIKQIAESDKLDLVLQDAVWVSPRLDITGKVIKALSDDKAAK